MDTSSTRVRIVSARRGFALPMALLVVGLLAISLTAAFAMTRGERRTNLNTAAQVDAFALAQAGLDLFLTNRKALGFTATPPASPEQIRLTLPGGYANVISVLVKPAVGTNPAIYAVRSTGVDTTPRLVGTPIARRTVAQYAYWQRFAMEVRAGWTSIGGLVKQGDDGILSGADSCGQQATLAGVAVPTSPGYVQNGGLPVPSGDPPILALGDVPASTADSLNIDWNAVLNGDILTPDLIIPPASWPSFSDPNYWPVIRVNGDLTLPSSGRGTLIVTGNLTMGGSRSWEGVVLVGNKLTSNGNNTVLGATVTGLNAQLGQAVAASDLGNGEKTFQYHSCNVARALNAFAQLYPLPNAWMDNWASY